MTPPPYLPIRTIIKFYDNVQRRHRNALFSRTMRKIAFIDSAWSGEVRPAHEEFWLVDVVHETCPGEARGCLLVNPLRKVEFGSIGWLVPGMFTEHNHGGFLVLVPHTGGVNWMTSKSFKVAIQGVHAIVVQQ